MMQASLCVGDYAAIPYYIEGIGLPVYSAEELCFCMKENAFLLDLSLMNDGLVDWIDRECGLESLARELYPMVHKKGSLSAFVAMIMEFVGFFSTSEIRAVEQVLKQGAGLSKIQRRKSQVDYLAQKKKYAAAIRGYGELLARWRRDPGETAEKLPAADVRAGILYNKGVMYTRLFLYGQAGADFLEAYRLDGRGEYLAAYLAAKRLELTEEEYVALTAQLPESYQVSLELEKKLEVLGSDWQGTVEYQRMMHHAQWPGEEPEDVSGADDKLIEAIKQQYRDGVAD